MERRRVFGVSVGSSVRVLVGLDRVGLGVAVSAAVEKVGEGSSFEVEGELQDSSSASSVADKSTVRKDLVMRISKRGVRREQV